MSDTLNKISFYVQDTIKNHEFAKNGFEGFKGNWRLFRNTADVTILSEKEGEDAAELIFDRTNGDRVGAFADYKGASLSVGDVVKIERFQRPTQYALCLSFGWEVIDNSSFEDQHKIITFTQHLND